MTGEDETTSEQHKAYTLLLELLSYQFAFPVQWIDTQRELLLSERDVQRIIEIGPANVLASMAKKSAKKLVGDRDAARSFEREYLHIDNPEDARRIYYEYDDSSSYTSDAKASNDTIQSEPAQPTPSGKHVVSVPVSEAPSVPISSPPTAPSTVVDKEFTAIEVIISLVAQKLRRAFDQVDPKESIQSLSKGKSTLQNELIGDLAAEFGDVLPDGSEGLALEALGENLHSGFSGKPGKTLKQLLDRFLSSKMPGGFGQAELAMYLTSRWGLGPSSQLTVQCFCVTIEPSSRLSDVSQVHEFLDKAVAQYAKHAGIALPTQTSTEGSQALQNTVAQVDKSELEALKNEHNLVLRKQLHVLAQHLGVQLKSDETTDLQGTGGPQQQLDKVYAELGNDYISRVQGIFDPKKGRRYSSWWNWHDSPASEQRLQALANRWTPELETMLRHYSQTHPARNKAEELLKLKPTTPRAPPPVFRFLETPKAPSTLVDDNGHIHYTEKPRPDFSGTGISQATYYDFVSSADRGVDGKSFVSCLRRGDKGWQYDSELTSTYHNALLAGTTTGISYVGKTALVTGAGPGSIGMEVVRGLLSGGARVIVTTSRSPATVGPTMAETYKELGACNSELILLPFNAASKKDVEDLVAYIYGDESQGLGLDIDFVVPFAAMPEPGREIDALDSVSELAHRAMLTNVLRMLGCIKQEKQRRNYVGRPTTVILPLSPNHGDFGGDGLYSESKIGLETLFNRYRSENWSSYLSIIGTVIGWTRGTALMSANNIVAEGIEKLGYKTFSAVEMAFNILALFSPSIINHSALEPVYADFSGGLMGFDKLKDHIIAIRKAIKTKQQVRQAICAERERQAEVLRGAKDPTGREDKKAGPQRKRSNILQQFPKMSSHQDMTAGLESLVGMVDMSRTVVIVGCSELGPWGSLRTRWQMESQGKLNLNGLTEMAWMMGLVDHCHSGLVDGKPYVGWVDAVSKKPVEEDEFETRYGEYIMKHSGIRALEPESLDGYDPLKKELLQEVVIDEDLPAFYTSESLAQSFKLRHGDKVDIFPKGSDRESWSVVVKRGATFFVPKATNGHQSIAAQLPKGWNAATYGIPEDIISQVDPITLYVLCCVSEAMFSAGIEDPFELYKHIHASELGNFIGSGAGGLKSMRDMYRHRYRDTPVQGDILQETFLNSMAAWTNMLLFGAAGPIKTPTGTCATAVESLDTACESIRSRRVKVALVGGTDDLQEEVSYEFSNMKATAVGEQEVAKGFLPSQISRPTASSRAGFVESAGCGVQIVMSAELAIQMGLPIYAIVAYTQMAGDGVGRSVPAPGQGILTAARETPAALQSPLLDLKYRQSRLEHEIATIEGWRLSQLADVSQPGAGEVAHKQMIESVSACRKADAQWLWNGDIRQLDPGISPIRAALAVWGITIDDICVASFHGTSTKANDKNESSVINQQMTHLRRSEGNPLFVVCQKYLTGHPKGAAGAWMLNGCLQILNSGLVPGNRNADDVDGALRAFSHLLYPSDTIHVSNIKAFMLTSFGFGQKGGIVIGVTPRALFAALPAARFEKYREQVEQRRRRIDQAFQKALMDNSVVRVKDRSAWAEAGKSEKAVFLDPIERI
ncbi:putative fatty acid synthase alpha subunit FasA [Nemania sp. FL0031]|nr:putative fatty acid synthase alpha subunit FasA [Nemania sp. FL0031]